MSKLTLHKCLQLTCLQLHYIRYYIIINSTKLLTTFQIVSALNSIELIKIVKIQKSVNQTMLSGTLVMPAIIFMKAIKRWSFN